MANFKVSKDFTKDIEGGFWNDPSAGWTYAGVTKRYFPLWPGFARLQQLKNKFYPGRAIPHYTLFRDEILNRYVDEFYRNTFWNKILSGDIIANQTLANLIYDFVVHKQYDAVAVINYTAKRFDTEIVTHKTKLSEDVLDVMNDKPTRFYSLLRQNRINYYLSSSKFSAKKKQAFKERVEKFPNNISGTPQNSNSDATFLLIGGIALGIALFNKSVNNYH